MTPAEPAKSDDERVRELLERRAARLRPRPVDAQEEEPFWIAELTLGETSYALPLGDLLGVVPVRLVVPVPLAAPHVLGVVRFRGDMVTALSLAWLLGAPGWRRDPSVLLVVAPGSGRRVAIDCEEVPKPVPLPMSAWTAHSAELEAEGGRTTVAWTTGQGRTLQFIRLGALLERHASSAAGGGLRGGREPHEGARAALPRPSRGDGAADCPRGRRPRAAVGRGGRAAAGVRRHRS